MRLSRHPSTPLRVTRLWRRYRFGRASLNLGCPHISLWIIMLRAFGFGPFVFGGRVGLVGGETPPEPERPRNALLSCSLQLLLAHHEWWGTVKMCYLCSRFVPRGVAEGDMKRLAGPGRTFPTPQHWGSPCISLLIMALWRIGFESSFLVIETTLSFRARVCPLLIGEGGILHSF